MKIDCKLNEEQRKERSRNALKVRWDRERENPVLKATHTGELRIGDAVFPCAVLEDGRRILSEKAMSTAMGSRSGASFKYKKKLMEETGALIPVFLAVPQLKDNINNSLDAALLTPIRYRKGALICQGFSAEILPVLCGIWLSARRENRLLPSQIDKANKAEVITLALAKTGITALIDEATGYQEERDRSALQKLFSQYISEEFMPWQKRFPQSYYKELFRLFGWKFDPSSVKRPALLGKFTNEFIYEQMPEGVLEELRTKNPSDDSGNRRTRHHQWLTQTIGVPHLDKHLVKIVTVMKLSDSLDDFKRMFAKIMEDDTLIDVSLEETTDSADNIQVDTKSKKLIDKTK